MAAVAYTLQLPPSTLRDYVAEVDRIASLVEALDESEDLPEATTDRLRKELVAAVTGTREKVDRAAAVLAQYESAAAFAAKEAARLDARRKYFDRQRERLENYLLWILTSNKLPTISGNTSSFAVRQNPIGVLVEDADSIPLTYMRFPEPAPAPDKAKIKSALQAGEDVPGCRLTRTERLVRS